MADLAYTPNFTPYQYLPTFAKVAIERLDADSGLRTASMLDTLLDGYATTYGRTVDHQDRESAHHICSRRFLNFVVRESAQAGVGNQ